MTSPSTLKAKSSCDAVLSFSGGELGDMRSQGGCLTRDFHGGLWGLGKVQVFSPSVPDLSAS